MVRAFPMLPLFGSCTTVYLPDPGGFSTTVIPYSAATFSSQEEAPINGRHSKNHAHLRISIPFKLVSLVKNYCPFLISCFTSWSSKRTSVMVLWSSLTTLCHSQRRNAATTIGNPTV